MNIRNQLNLLSEFARTHHVFYVYVGYLEALVAEKDSFDYEHCVIKLRDAMMNNAQARVEDHIARLYKTLEFGRV